MHILDWCACLCFKKKEKGVLQCRVLTTWKILKQCLPIIHEVMGGV